MPNATSARIMLTACFVTGLLGARNLPAFGSEPPAAPSPNSPTLPTPAVAKSPSTSPAPPASVTAPPVDAAAAAAATAKSAQALGYSPKMLNGKPMYCRKESKVGTRFESFNCVTPEQVSQLALRGQNNRESVGDLQRNSLNMQGGDLPPQINQQRNGPTYR